jgi:hypothetical protein
MRACERLPVRGWLLSDRDALAPEVVHHLLYFVHVAIAYLIDILHAIREMEDQVIMLIDLGTADMIAVQPWFEFGHEIVKAARAHGSSSGFF